MANNPASSVEVVADEDVCVYGTAVNQCIAEGDKVTMMKAHYAHCADTLELTADYMPPKTSLVSIAAGSSFQAEVESGSSLLIHNTAALLYSFGTEASPLVIPEGEVITENVPELLEAGEHTKSLSGVTAYALTNCTSEDQKVQLITKG